MIFKGTIESNEDEIVTFPLLLAIRTKLELGEVITSLTL